MNLYERFELLDLDRDDGVKTFAAREISTGRPVKVHLFVNAAAPIQAALLKAIDRLPDAAGARVILRGKHEGTPYVVTDMLAEHAGLSEWVQAAGHGAKPKKPALETAGAWKLPVAEPPPSAPPKSGGPASIDRKFSELFPAGERPILSPQTGIQPPPAPKPSVPAHEPGEFTRMFQAPGAPATSPVAPAAPTKKEPGEFTRMFQSPVAPAKAPPAPAPPSGPSDFERFFETPSPAGPMPQSPALQQPLTPQGSGHNKGGEFTRMFGKVDMPAPSRPETPATPKEPGEFTRMFQSPAAPAAPPAAPLQPLPVAQAPSPAPPPVAPKPSGPGEYTRQFAAPAPLTLGQTSGPPVAASPPFMSQGIAQPPIGSAPAPLPPKKTNLALILGIVGMVVVAALIVVFFAMRPK